ncbi:MAG: hypothetical protein WC343_08820 [Bacilli bacterium]
MRLIMSLAVIFALFCLPLMAQEPELERFGAGGIGYFANGKPTLQGWAALGIPITSDAKALSYTNFDVSPVNDGGQFSVGGIHIRYAMRTGIAYRLMQFGQGLDLYGLAAPGFSADGADFKSSVEYGGFIHKTLKKGWGVMVAFTAEKTEGTDFAPRIGITRKF